MKHFKFLLISLGILFFSTGLKADAKVLMPFQKEIQLLALNDTVEAHVGNEQIGIILQQEI